MLFCQQERLRAFHHLPCYVHHRWFPTENKFILPFIKVLFLSERVFVIPFPPFKHKPWLAEFTGAFHTNTFQGIYYFLYLCNSGRASLLPTILSCNDKREHSS